MADPRLTEATESVSSAEGGWAAEERGADSSDVGARSTVTQTEFEEPKLSPWWKFRYLLWSIRDSWRGRRSKDVTFD